MWFDGQDKVQTPDFKTKEPLNPPQRQRTMGWSLKKNGVTDFYIFGGFRFYGQMNEFFNFLIFF
jgi:hypothetical protein